MNEPAAPAERLSDHRPKRRSELGLAAGLGLLWVRPEAKLPQRPDPRLRRGTIGKYAPPRGTMRASESEPVILTPNGSFGQIWLASVYTSLANPIYSIFALNCCCPAAT